MEKIKKLIPLYYVFKGNPLIPKNIYFNIYLNQMAILTGILLLAIPLILFAVLYNKYDFYYFFIVIYIISIVLNFIYNILNKNDIIFNSEKTYNIKNNSLMINKNNSNRLIFIDKDTNKLIKVNISELITKDKKYGEFSIKTIYSDNVIKNIKIKIKSCFLIKNNNKYYIENEIEIIKNKENI